MYCEALLRFFTALYCAGLYHTHTHTCTTAKKKTSKGYSEDQRCSGKAVEGSKTDLVNPQLAHDDVVHCGGDLSPHVVVPAGVEVQVNGTWKGNRGQKDIRAKKYHSAAL